MCYAILKVRYRSATERDAFIEVEALEQLNVKLSEVKDRAEVTSVTIFSRGPTHKLVTEWRVEEPA